ncbi:MAG: GNAT family N-acetyltransferase [Bacteroidota bacterium]
MASSPQGTIFNSSRWAAIIQEVFGVEHSIYAVLERDEVAGGISFFHKKKAGLKVVTRLPLTPYNGVLFQAPRGEKDQKVSTEHREIFDLILEKFEKEFHFVHFALHPSVTDLRPFLWRGWYTLPQYTYVNSLTDLNQTWSLLSSSLRRKINRAEENQFKVFEKDDPTLLLRFQEMSYAKARREVVRPRPTSSSLVKDGRTRREFGQRPRRGARLKPVLSFDTFQRYCLAALGANLLRIYSAADSEGNIHAERAVVVHKDRAYDWIAGSNLQIEDESGPKSSDLDRRFRRILSNEPVGNSANGLVEGHANQLLVWEIFKRLSAEGVRTFDFLGANTPSVVEFKRAFGGNLNCYFEVRWFSSWVVHTLNFLNQRWRDWRRSG